MRFHTVAFSETITTASLTGLVTPVIDNTVTINGDNLLVPAATNQLFAAAPFATAGAGPVSAQLQSPSLRQMWFPNATPVQVGATLDANEHVFEVFDNPVNLETNEGLNLSLTTTGQALIGQQGAIVFLCDGARAPVKSSRIFTMRTTAAITLAANSWVNGPLTFDQPLPVSDYDVVGMRAEGTGLLAARLVFVGTSAVTRPGCPGNANATNRDLIEFRLGKLGVWGTFNSLTPPSVDCIGATGTAQTIYLDLVKR